LEFKKRRTHVLEARGKISVKAIMGSTCEATYWPHPPPVNSFYEAFTDEKYWTHTLESPAGPKI